jgi:hypothetical protein
MFYKIHSPVYFEHVFNDKKKVLYVNASRKRLDFNNAMVNNDYERAYHSGQEYLALLKEIIDYLNVNRNISLKQQPFFVWNYGKSKHLSPCWKWELTMTYAALYDISIERMKTNIKKKDFRSAIKLIQGLDGHVEELNNVIDTWTWKTNDNVFPTYDIFWKGATCWLKVLKKICVLNYGWDKFNLTEKVDALKHIETECQNALYHWGVESENYHPEKIMNWSICMRAMFRSKQLWEDEKHGEALGLLQHWKKTFKTFMEQTSQDFLVTCLEPITKNAIEIKELYEDWKIRNDTVYFEEIQKIEL